jgi:hypothetical protein
MQQHNCEKTGLLCCLEVEFLSLPSSSIVIFASCAAPFSSMCSTQAVNSSQKSQLCCNCLFPRCALTLKGRGFLYLWASQEFHGIDYFIENGSMCLISVEVLLNFFPHNSVLSFCIPIGSLLCLTMLSQSCVCRPVFERFQTGHREGIS